MRATPTYIVLLALLLGACTEIPALHEAEIQALAGQHEQAYLALRDAARRHPEDRTLRAALVRERDLALAQLSVQASDARAHGRADAARDLLLRLETVDADDPRVSGLHAELDRDARIELHLGWAAAALAAGKLEEARRMVREVLAESPSSAQALALQQRIADKMPAPVPAQLMAAAFQKAVTLEFREAPLRNVFETLGRSSGVNFVFDKDVKSDARINIYLKDVTLDEAMRVILSSQQLDRKLLNENSVFIYPNTAAKQREHQELVTRSFYLANADVKQAQMLIKTMAKTRDIYIDERLNLIIIRDTREVVRLVEGLIASIDLPEPEVMLEVEVMEITSDQVDQLGLQYPQQVSYGVPNVTGDITLSQGGLRTTIGNPAIVATLHGTSGTSNLLANPKLRARNREKARVQIGEKLPVFTTTSVANVGISTSVAYLDTGLKLEVEPSVQLDNDVIMKVNLEVSNVINQVNGPQGSIAYDVGTRNATTSLRLHDGETQILAGLINDEDRKAIDGLPGVSRLPLLGRLFGAHTDTHNKSEIVLLITPRIVRNLSLPDASQITLSAGSDASPGAETTRLHAQARIAIPAANRPATTSAPADGDSTAAAAPARGVLAVSTSGEVAPGETASVTLQNLSEATLRGTVEFDTAALQSTDGSAATSMAFELAPRAQKVVVLRALRATKRVSTEVSVAIQEATAADGSSSGVDVEGSTSITVVPR